MFLICYVNFKHWNIVTGGKNLMCDSCLQA